MEFAVIIVVLLLLIGIVYAIYRGMQASDPEQEKKDRRRKQRSHARPGDHP